MQPEPVPGIAWTLASLNLPTVIGEPTAPTAVQMAGIRFELDDSQVPANIAQNVGLRDLPHTHLVSR